MPRVPGSSSGCVSSGSLGRGRGCHQSSRCEQVLLGSQPSTAITPPRPLQLGTLQVFVMLCSSFSFIPFVRKAKVPQEPGLLFYPAGYTAPTQEKTPLLVTSQESAQLRFASLFVASESGTQTSSLTMQGSLHCLCD